MATDHNVTLAVITVVFAYLLGSVSAAKILAKLCHLPDPSKSGSGNPGATNMLRIGGKWVGATVLLFDTFKGIFAVWLALQLELELIVVSFCGLAAFLGHLYPVYYRFQGGKGVATFFGVVCTLSGSLGGGGYCHMVVNCISDSLCFFGFHRFGSKCVGVDDLHPTLDLLSQYNHDGWLADLAASCQYKAFAARNRV